MTNSATVKREVKGLELAAKGAVTRIAWGEWDVKGDSGKHYTVERHINNEDEEMWVCDCPDHTYRLIECKHIVAVQELDHEVRMYFSACGFHGTQVARLKREVSVRASKVASKWYG